MTDDGTRGRRWGPWALVVGVGAVGLLGLARELRDRRRGGDAARTDPETDGEGDS